ncbi:dipeptidase [Winogradskyella immobilis]|uniref:Membrane dipeptidase n=1 Tax=Winogradskyella immobilis TaxID=2816852 RepID=A0ABS8EP85_9FLAO|nr:membrane dipeptidase [Winogradskyella immobilis]MCC1484963.1 membrane dipeptidase [Winogradskyella immobilis]MCG0017055.1 dipeptidase [Winogradskyella immobilis]
MAIKRRDFIKKASIGALFPMQILNSFASDSHQSNFLYNNLKSKLFKSDIDKLYNEAIVFDGIVITRGWNEDSFKALEKTGYTGFNASIGSGSLESVLQQLKEWQERITDNQDKLILAKSAEDFITAKQEKKTAIFLGFQNTNMIGTSIQNINKLYDAGTRWLQLTYNERNLIGDGCTERTNVGLSDFGLEAVSQMNELGMIIDLSHCGRQTTNEAIQFSKTGVSFNHSMCEHLHKNHPRAKTDEQIKAMADKGGIIGIISLGYMIGPNLGTDTTLETYVDHIDHAVKVAGIDHVGLAADFAIQGLKATGATRENWYVPRLTRFKPSYKVQWPPWIPELDTTDRYRYVARLLDKRGYNSTDIEKILGRNWLRFYRETLKP